MLPKKRKKLKAIMPKNRLRIFIEAETLYNFNFLPNSRNANTAFSAIPVDYW
jgi:hypothetical protein